MELQSKLAILADAAKYDASCASSGSDRKRPMGGIGDGAGIGICHSYTPDGRCISLLKLLLTNVCILDCHYCINRTSSETPRARFTVDEVVQLTMSFYRRNYIEGLFLSSGIRVSADATMEDMVEVARKLREEHKFGGYIHLKAVPGASQALLEKAGLYADRLSVNIELPRAADLAALAPAKTHGEIETTMSSIREGILEAKEVRSTAADAPRFAPAGQSTQMIVGATAATDGDILNKASQLYRAQRLKRVYYSAFSPIPKGDPTLPLSPAPLIREHRLYQADWLLRFYGFKIDELMAGTDGQLSLDRDPKLDWALRNRAFFPIDVNAAPREALLRIPGCGVRSVNRIIETRRFHKLSLGNLSKLRVVVSKARPFIITTDHLPSTQALDGLALPARVTRPKQLELFEAPVAALSGEL